jgi:WhiB family redox-sensing transcriptional regulator
MVTTTDSGWEARSACLGTDPDLFFAAKGRTYAEARDICAQCPVLPDCLNAAVERREQDGMWGGASERERRLLRVAWLQKVPGHPYRAGHDCAWCRAVDAHLARLTGDQPVRLNLNSPGARHGKASTYARGCRCGACSIANRPVGRRLRDAGYDVLTWWMAWFGPHLDRNDGDARYAKAKVLAELDASEAAA